MLFHCSLCPLPPVPSLTPSTTSLTCPPPSSSTALPLRLRLPLQPHPPQPVRRVRGPAGPPPAGGAGQDDAHVPVEGWDRAGLAGGCHGNADVHPQLLRKCQEWKGRIKAHSRCGCPHFCASLLDTWCLWSLSSISIWQVLLGLTDEDLELGLGVSSLMHRRKLRLAIEDYRDAENGRG